MCSLLKFNNLSMKKVISISAEEKVIDEFTSIANEFWTNRTNLISMFMVDFINNKRIHFERKSNTNNISYESFSEKESNELKSEWKNSFESICNSLKSI